MPTFIKAGYWKKDEMAPKGYLSLDKLIRDIVDTLSIGELTEDEMDAIQAANSPSGTNAFATTDDIPIALSELSQDATHRVVTDVEKADWNSKQDSLIDDEDEVGPEYTLTINDSYVTISNANNVTIIVPNNSSVEFPIGTSITIEQGGAGQVQVIGEDGVIINAYDSGVFTLGQYAAVQLIKKSSNTWTLIGGTSDGFTTTTTTTIV